MIDEGERVRLANLCLQGEEKTQHELCAKTHRCAYVADDNKSRLAQAVPMPQFHWHALILQIRSDRGLGIQLPALGALLSQRNSRSKSGCQASNLSFQLLLLGVGK